MEMADVENLVGIETVEWECTTVVSANDSSVTQLQSNSKCSSETEYNPILDDVIENLLSAQFPVTVQENDFRGAGGQGVEEWLNTNANEREATNSLTLEEDDEDESAEFPAQDVEKIAAALSDVIMNDQCTFNPEAWEQTDDDDQIVPGGSLKTKIINEIRLRLALALMNFINAYSSTSTDSPSRYFFEQILYYASNNVCDAYEQNPEVQSGVENRKTGSTSRKTLLSSFKKLTDFNRGEYFSDLRLRFKKVPKTKKPIVRAVEKFVNKSIETALESKNAILFTGYALIPKVVEDCVKECGIPFSAEQVAKYGFRLQKAAYDEMIYRCFNFLEFAGYNLRRYDATVGGAVSDFKSAISSEQLSCSAEKQPDQHGNYSDRACGLLSSQESHSGDTDSESVKSSNSQGSSINDHENETENVSISNRSMLSHALEYALQNGEDIGEEVLRRHLDEHSPSGSPGSSWNSCTSSQSPPVYSLPERDRSPMLLDFQDEDEDNGLTGPLEDSHVDFSAVILASIVSNASAELEIESEDSFDEGPQRRRRRLN